MECDRLDYIDQVILVSTSILLMVVFSKQSHLIHDTKYDQLV